MQRQRTTSQFSGSALMSVRIIPISVPADVSVPEPEIVLELGSAPETASLGSRAILGGKFLWVGQEKLYVRGVTYGTFRPRMDGSAFPSPRVVEQDFSLMSANGVNAVRTYTPPPHWLLEIALKCNLRVLVGMQGERHYTFLHEKKMVREIRKQVRGAARACAGHPAVLGYLVANEIPASIVRWHGASAVEKFLKQLRDEVKEEDPEALVSYANYPSTEYLDLSFLDLVCFNVFLESQDKYEAYLARLQNLAGNRPLLVTEIGLDSHRNGDKAQAACLDWQIRKAFAAGCAGAFAYAWTDEWYRGGEDVIDWDFGLTSRTREPKLALGVVRKAFEEVPFASKEAWPKISVVVCTFNGSRTIRECLEGIGKLRYPNYETIVVDDGSTDGAGDIAAEYDVRLIRTENQGLSAARNLGWQSATGEIVAYIDDDASPDPDWLTYLAAAFLKEEYAGVGGPNIPVPDDGDTANCIANSPGGPAHVLLSDCEAEHIPGCNMAFRRSWLEAINGFDPQFRQAGDDVDICWRTREQGGKLGFSPAAMVWHHYRRTVRAYWKQQMSYGKAEAMLERKWPEKYNSGGYATWAGHIYVNGIFRPLSLSRGRIYQGTWGTAAYARLYQPAPNVLNSLPLTHEWQLTNLVLAALCAVSMFWGRLLGVLPVAVVAFVLSLVPAISAALKVHFPSSTKGRFTRFRLRVLTGLLHLMQPLTRLWSRLKEGLTPWRCRGASRPAPLWPVTTSTWSEHWQAPDQRLNSIAAALQTEGGCVLRGGEHDRWDLEVRCGFLGAARLLMGVEDHRGGQFVRLRLWPDVPAWGPVLTVGFAALALGAFHDHAWPAAAVLGLMALLLALRTLQQCTAAMATIARGLKRLCKGGM